VGDLDGRIIMIHSRPRHYTGVAEEEVWEVTVSVILSKKVYMYMCPILNGFQDGAISLYGS
jgi:hypothetical protein